MAQLVYQRRGLSYGGIRLAISQQYAGEGVLDPPPGFTGVVSAPVSNQSVTSAYNDPAHSYVPATAWIMSSYGRGMFYKDYGTPQDGSVYRETQVFARIACMVDFYVLRDDNDNANFTIVEDGRLLTQANSAGPATGTPAVLATVSLTPGMHTLRFAVLGGISIYVSKLTVRT